MKQIDGILFTQLAKAEETSIFTLDSVLNTFASTVVRAAEQPVPHSSVKLYYVPVLWWTEIRQDVIQAAQKHALKSFSYNPQDKCGQFWMCTTAQRTVQQY